MLYYVSKFMHTALYFAFVQATILLPGYVLLKRLGFLAKNPGLQLSISYLVTIVFFAFLATLGYVLKVPLPILRFVGWAAIIWSLFMLIKRRYFTDLWKLRFPLICLAVMSLLSIAFIGLSFNSPYTYIPDPQPLPTRNYQTLNVKVLNVAQTQANDNYIPYRQAQFFINRSDPAKDSFINEWGVHFFQRTPLMGAVTANYFNLLNDKPPLDYTWSANSIDLGLTYAKFQIIASVLNAIFIVPAFFLLIKLFNKRTAAVTCLFLAVSQFFIYNAVFSWPKSFVAFFILLSWLLLLEKTTRYTLLAGIASGIAYLAHDLAILYIAASVIFLLANKRFREILIFAGSSVVFAIPWMFTASIIYNRPSSFILYPFSVNGLPQPGQEKQIFSQFLHTSPLRHIYVRLANFFYIFSPYQLLTSEGGQDLGRRIWALGLYSVSGAIGLGLIVPATIGALKKLRDLGFWILVITPVLFSVLIIGWPKGLAALHFAEAIIVLISGLGIHYLLKLKNKLWLVLAFTANCLQLVFFTVYSYKYAVSGWFTDLKDLFLLTFLLIAVLICGWLVYRAATNKKVKFVGLN